MQTHCAPADHLPAPKQWMDTVPVVRPNPAARSGGLQVHEISLTVEGNRTLLERISFSAAAGTLTAVIGPSGSGKSTLVKVLAGGTQPDSGAVRLDGHDVHTAHSSLPGRIGMVPQDDVIHAALTIGQALDYAAQLRMPPRTGRQQRQQVIGRVLEELQLTPHVHTRIGTLSGGQRKRASIALELLTAPSLLILDEPTTGLDPMLDRQVMKMLRRLADAGRIVVVVTHSLTNLEYCDQLLLLAPGGKTAFCGTPRAIGPTMGSSDWADIFTDLRTNPDAAAARFMQHSRRYGAPAFGVFPEGSAAIGRPVHSTRRHQIFVIARRQFRLVFADRRYFWLVALLPFVVGLLPLSVVGNAGFGQPAADGLAAIEPKQLITLLNFAAVLMGTALTVRELVGERAVFRREQAAGLSASAYLLAKIGVFGAVAVLQSVVLVLVVTAPVIGKPRPTVAAALGSPMLELLVGVAATCVVATITGLAMSALARSTDRVIVWLAAALTAQFVLAGGTIPVTDRPLLDPISWLTPARWGFAAPAATVDLTNLVAGISQDTHWQHTAAAWIFDLAMLGVLAACYAGFARWRIRLTGADQVG
jgi:ABC-type multidrug transport system ATPase subunit